MSWLIWHGWAIGLSDENGILDTYNVGTKLFGARLRLATDTPDWIGEGQEETVLRDLSAQLVVLVFAVAFALNSELE